MPWTNGLEPKSAECPPAETSIDSRLRRAAGGLMAFGNQGIHALLTHKHSGPEGADQVDFLWTGPALLMTTLLKPSPTPHIKAAMISMSHPSIIRETSFLHPEMACFSQYG